MSSSFRTFRSQIFPATTATIPFSNIPGGVGKSVGIPTPNSLWPASTGVNQTLTSSAIMTELVQQFMVQVMYTGQLSGTINLLQSNDGLNFSPINTFGSSAFISQNTTGTTGNICLPQTTAPMWFTQFQFVPSSAIASSSNAAIRATMSGFAI